MLCICNVGLYLSSCSHRSEIHYKWIECCSYPLSCPLSPVNPSHPPGYLPQTFSFNLPALLNLKPDKHACTCRRRLMPPSPPSFGCPHRVWVVQMRCSHLPLFAVFHLCVSHAHTHRCLCCCMHSGRVSLHVHKASFKGYRCF